MTTIEQALQMVIERTPCNPAWRVPLSEALGGVLAEDVASDIDSPPYDKSLMDGYAVIAADFVDGVAELTVLEQVTAGAVPVYKVVPGTSTRIMTGAPMPAGADAVVVVERSQPVDRGDGTAVVRLRDEQVASGQNILPRAASLASGEVVLRAGCELRPIEIGLLAEVGASDVPIYEPPQVAVLATGNELVPATERPRGAQIRNSNGPMLTGLVEACGCECRDLGIGRDDAGELMRLVRRGLNADVLVLSGGVSAGVLDLVPSVLHDLGVEQVFHKVELKPGRPLWFGVLPDPTANKLVFGLPGNPVSSLVCFELFVRPALAKLAGREANGLPSVHAALAGDYHQRTGRPTYHPARLASSDDGLQVETLPWLGSADLRSLSNANCLAVFPGDREHFPSGETIEVLLWNISRFPQVAGGWWE